MQDSQPSDSSPVRAHAPADAGSEAAASSQHDAQQTQHQTANSSAANSSDCDVASCATSSRLATSPLQQPGETLGERIASPLPPLPRPWAQQVQLQQQLCPAAPGEDSAGSALMMMRRSFSLPSSCSSQSLSLMGEQDSSVGGSGTSQQQPLDPEQQQAQQPALLQELGVSMDTVLRLFSGGCAAEFDQPVWMVVNLQGKVKGSYTSAKMVEFVKRGTLSSAQALLGIDRNLPYITRQELAYYRRLDQLLTAVHGGGAVYEPLTQHKVQQLRQLGVLPSQWQPTVRRTQQQQEEGSAAAAAAEQLAGLQLVSRADSGSSTGSAVPAPSSSSSSLASARLQAALERLCGCSIAAARQEEPCAPASAAAAKAGRADAAEATAAAEPLACPAMDAAAQRLAQARGSPPAAAAAAADSAQASSAPMWLYINHLGWCRGPFPGAKVVQAHLCGRLPRDTLLAALEPDLPHSLLTVDVSYFFRPLGVLLDNVANGWRYKPVGWRDVAIRGMDMNSASAASSLAGQQLAGRQPQQLQQQPSPQPWQPLVWDGPGPPPELINPELLQPPLNAPSQAQAMGDRTGSGRRGQQRSEATSSSNSSNSNSSRASRRQRQCWSPVQQPAEPLAALSQLQQHRQAATGTHVGPPMAYLLPAAVSPAASGYAAALQGLGLGHMQQQQQQQYAPVSMAPPVHAYQQPLPYSSQALPSPAPALPPLLPHQQRAPLLDWAMQLQGGEQQLALAHTLAQQQLLLQQQQQQVSAAQHLEGQHLVAPHLQEQLLWPQGLPSIGAVQGFGGDVPLHGLPPRISPALAGGPQGPFGLIDPAGSTMAGLHQQQQLWAAMQQHQQHAGMPPPQGHLQTQPTSSPEQASQLARNYPLN